MFDSLSDRFHDAFKSLRGQARLTEANIGEALREIRLALLEADVNISIVKEFIDSIKEDILGQDVLRSVTPGQQVIKIVNDHLTELMGSEKAALNLSSKPAVIMMVGLHGSGKTTSSAKLAARLKQDKKKVLLVAADVYRPAAIDQLEFLGKQIGVDVFSNRSENNVPNLARTAMQKAQLENYDCVIVDTAGRLQIDDVMVQELALTSQATMASEILLVADAALGQEAVSVADHFHKALGLTGVVLTKLDGDARGGAALSIRKVTSCPIKYVGLGEKIEDFDVFYPERMASRILGMGDVVSLVEKAAAEIDEKEAEKMQQKLKKNNFDFNDFLSQLRQMQKLGGLEGILKFLPGGKQLKNMIKIDDKQFSRMEAIICSMTKKEREEPTIIDFSRKKRIAKGSGTSVDQVAQLVNQFNQMKKMIKKTGLFSKMGGGMPANAAAMNSPMAMNSMMRSKSGSNFTPSKKKKRKKRKK
ncbi:signal recognition particle protein [Lentisphaerota bacterium WC36G]|nr:signal recognition particle protein [Lentisphaerae bacterium WC36]